MSTKRGLWRRKTVERLIATCLDVGLTVKQQCGRGICFNGLYKNRLRLWAVAHFATIPSKSNRARRHSIPVVVILCMNGCLYLFLCEYFWHLLCEKNYLGEWSSRPLLSILNWSSWFFWIKCILALCIKMAQAGERDIIKANIMKWRGELCHCSYNFNMTESGSWSR